VDFPLIKFVINKIKGIIMMKTIVFLLVLAPLSYLLSQSSKHSYVGVQVCSPCHKTEKQGSQLDIWQKSKHSQAFATLKSEDANKIAKEKGFETPAVETAECLKCHATGYNLEASLLGEKFKVEDGVQCETCHGPGSDYKNMKIMKSHEESVAHGMTEITDIENFCKTCHNPESPTFKDINITEAWEQIKHPVPDKK
jgi:hypothetical protein